MARAGLVPDRAVDWRIQMELPAFFRALVDVAYSHNIPVDEVLSEMDRVPGAAPAVRRVNGSVAA